jgi:DnaA family protein
LAHSANLQLALNVSLQDGLTFENFFACPESEAILAALTELQCTDDFQSIGIWGASGSGRSHLLQAAVQKAETNGCSAIFLPGSELVAMDPAGLLQGLAEFDVVVIDDIDHLLNNAGWELALFEFYNRLHDNGNILVFSCAAPVAELTIQLADLASRLAWGTLYHLPKLNDQQKLAALQLRAHSRGMLMSDEVAKFIMSRSSRDFVQLIDVLDQLDKASIKAQRKLSVPFVKTICHW